ncbi:MAG: hypothetical protein RSC96_05550 [Oscillospiraceae bacterium]
MKKITLVSIVLALAVAMTSCGTDKPASAVNSTSASASTSMADSKVASSMADSATTSVAK